MSIFGAAKPEKPDMRCSVCYAEWNEDAARRAGEKGCPNCHTKVQAQRISEDGYIRINWQQLRLLVIWAQRWSMNFDRGNKGNQEALKALENIVAHLNVYRPKYGEPLSAPLPPQPNQVRLPVIGIEDAFIVGQIHIKKRNPVPPLEFDENAPLTPNAEGKIPSFFQPKKRHE